MKNIAILATTSLTAALMAASLVGCGGQASTTDTAAADSEAVATTEQTQDQIIAELKDAIANEPTYKSVTLTEVTKSAAKGESTADDALEATTVYKFDASGEELKTDMTGKMGDIAIRYCSDGEDAVCVTDGPVYSGTTEQFDQSHFAGVEAYLKEAVGDLNTLVDCTDTVVKEQQGDVISYELTLDPQKYMASDEILTLLKESGDPVESATVTLGFDKDGHIVSIHEVVAYASSTTDRTYELSDFDSTIIDPMPEADKTYEEMEADISQKLDEFAEGLDETSSDTTEAK